MSVDDIGISIFSTNFSAVMSQLTTEMSKAESAAFYALADVALQVEKMAKNESVAGGSHAAGTKTPARHGGPPARISGALQRSIHTEIRRGFGTYTASVFPTVVYARAVELGARGGAKNWQGKPWPDGVEYPYIIPTGKKAALIANDLFAYAFVKRWMR